MNCRRPDQLKCVKETGDEFFEARSGDPKVAPYQPTSCHAIERLSNHHGGGLG